MRTPNVGDQYVSARNSASLGQAVTWRVTKVAKKADERDYVELEPVNAQLSKKTLSVRALSDGRLFSRVQAAT